MTVDAMAEILTEPEQRRRSATARSGCDVRMLQLRRANLDRQTGIKMIGIPGPAYHSTATRPTEKPAPFSPPIKGPYNKLRGYTETRPSRHPAVTSTDPSLHRPLRGLVLPPLIKLAMQNRGLAISGWENGDQCSGREVGCL